MKQQGMTKRKSKDAKPSGTHDAPARNPFEASRSEARAILGGIAERTFARLESEGILTPSQRGRGGRASVYDLRTVVPSYLVFVQGVKPTDDRDARSRRDRSQAELNELTLASKRKELVPREAVILAGQAYTKAWAAKMRGLPRRCVQAGLITRDQEPGLAEICREFLTEISSWKTIADEQPEGSGS